MSLRKTLQLQNGIAIPQIGLGTWLSKPHEVENSVRRCGRAYTHGWLLTRTVARSCGQSRPGIATSTARMCTRTKMRYARRRPTPRPPRSFMLPALPGANEAGWMQVGAALKKVIPSVIRREELFITSKLWNNAHHPSEVEKQLDITLSQLGTPYLDLYLIHWPVAFVSGREKIPVRADKPDVAEIDVNTSLVDTWNAMIALRETGKVKAIGVSNFTIQHLEAIIKATGERPTVNQIEAHPLLPQDDMVEYCRKQEIHITAYSPLGNNREWKCGVKVTVC